MQYPQKELDLEQYPHKELDPSIIGKNNYILVIVTKINGSLSDRFIMKMLWIWSSIHNKNWIQSSICKKDLDLEHYPQKDLDSEHTESTKIIGSGAVSAKRIGFGAGSASKIGSGSFWENRKISLKWVNPIICPYYKMFLFVSNFNPPSPLPHSPLQAWSELNVKIYIEYWPSYFAIIPLFEFKKKLCYLD